jgi:hypothetical protein
MYDKQNSKSFLKMIFYTFDLSIATKSQVFKIIREMRDEGLTGGIYLWVNQVSKKM